MASIETSLGRRVRTVPLVPIATQPRQLAFRAPLPLADVSRGDYVLTIEARTTLHTVNRKVPFSVD
jgi:hypothetical protein